MNFKSMISTALMAAAAVSTFALGSFNRVPPPQPVSLLAAATVPVDSASEIPLNQSLVVTFRTLMDSRTINSSTFTLQQRGMPVFGAVAYSGVTATFTPAVLFTPLTQYTATLSRQVRSISGARMLNDLVWSFTTGPVVILSPQLPVNLGTCQNFVVLAGSTITNTSVATLITGNIGLSPAAGTAIVGITAANVVGTIYTVDGTGPAGNVMDPVRLTTAKNDLTTAYVDAAGRVTPDVVYAVPTDIGGLTLAPGLYKFASSASITTANLTLSGPATGVWIFQIASTLTVANGMRVTLAGGATPANIFWQVGTSGTMGTTSHMEGTIMADQSIDFQTGSTLNGRALARIGAVTLAAFGGSLPTACTTSAPGTLTAVANTVTRAIDLSWGAVTGATSYNVYRATVSGGPYTLLTAVTAPATLYSDATVVAGTTYYYVVRAFNVCESGNSPEAAAVLPAACATGAPGTLAAVPNTVTRAIDLSWGAVTGATSYNVYRAAVSGGPYTLLTAVTAPATTYSDATVIAGVQYYYVVRAFNVCESLNSPEASAILPAACATSAPGALTTIPNAVTRAIDLSWGAVVGATSYNVYRATVSGGPYTLLTAVTAPVTVYSDTTVVSGVRYYYVVRAFNVCESGNSPESSAILACFTSAPTGLIALQNAGSYTGIGLSWPAVTGAVSYNIYRSTVSGGPYLLINTVNAPATTFADLSVQTGVVYYYVIRAYNGCESSNSPQAAAIRSAC